MTGKSIAEEWRENYIKMKDAAEELGLKEWTLRSLVGDKGVEVFQLPIDRRAKFIRRSDLPTLTSGVVVPAATPKKRERKAR